MSKEHSSWFEGACTDQTGTVGTSKSIMMVMDSNILSKRICESIVINEKWWGERGNSSRIIRINIDGLFCNIQHSN